MKVKIPIIYEDSEILVINKPAGLVVHPDGRSDEYTLVDWILKNYPEIKKETGEPMVLTNGETIYRPGIVHRLDRDTSGVMIIAKNDASFAQLKMQFQGRDIQKVYRAFVYGNIKVEKGVIERPITRSRKDFRLWSAQRGGRGEAREAITEYRVLERGGSGESMVTYVELRPRTGRTHQIRVHMKAINFPVVADKLYAPKREPVLGFDRLALHAFRISLLLRNGKEATFEAPLPADFKKAEKLLKA